MHEDDTFARTYPDIQKLRSNADSEELVHLLREFSRAGIKLEDRVKALELIRAEHDGEQRARGQIWTFVQWVVGIGVAIGAFIAGQHAHK